MAGDVQLPYPFIDGLTRRQQEQIYMDFKAMARQGGGHVPTILVAASDSLAENKAVADVICGNVGAGGGITRALALLPAYGGRLVFAEGTYTLSSQLTLTILADQKVEFMGMGEGTHITGGLTIVGTAASSPYLHIHNMRLDGAAGASTALEIIRCPCLVENVHAVVSGNGTAISVSASTQGQTSQIINNRVESTGTDDRNGIFFDQAQEGIIAYNTVIMSGSGTGSGIRTSAAAGFTGACLISNNIIHVPANVVGITIHGAVGDAQNSVVANNRITGGLNGISVTGVRHHIHSNLIKGAAEHGIYVVFPTSSNIYITNNYVQDSSSGTPNTFDHIRVTGGDGSSHGAPVDNVVAWNKVRGTSARFGISLNVDCTNCAIFGNDTFGGWTTADIDDQGTDTRREDTLLPPGSLLPSGGTPGQVVVIPPGGGDPVWGDDPTLGLATAAGDMLVALAANVLSTLSVDRTGQILITDFTQPLKVKWGPKLTVSDTAPSAPRPGDIWFDTT